MTPLESPGLQRAAVGLPFLWLLVFAFLPLLLIVKISFSQMQLGVPPYTPLLGVNADGETAWQGGTANYAFIASDSLYAKAYLNSVRIAAITTLLALLIAFPMAYAIVRAPRRWQTSLLILVLLPFWTSFLIRVYAWVGLLRPNGLINSTLEALGVIDEPLKLLNTEFAVFLGMVFCYLPYMLLPLYARLEKLDVRLTEAALDLGASPTQAFWRITVPLSWPGIVAGCLLVFVPAVGEFVIPELLSGADVLMIGKVMWSEFFTNRDWPLSAAVATVLLLVLAVPVVVFQNRSSRSAA
ncbi:MAG: ABC transporter permease [Rhodospirillaceae bacterium]|nr:ABC transporter permease [Rhodospirillaceae bacterium]